MRHIANKRVLLISKTHLSFQCPHKPVALFCLYPTTPPPPQPSCVNVPVRYSHHHSQPGRMKYTNIHTHNPMGLSRPCWVRWTTDSGLEQHKMDRDWTCTQSKKCHSYCFIIMSYDCAISQETIKTCCQCTLNCFKLKGIVLPSKCFLPMNSGSWMNLDPFCKQHNRYIHWKDSVRSQPGSATFHFTWIHKGVILSHFKVLLHPIWSFSLNSL